MTALMPSRLSRSMVMHVRILELLSTRAVIFAYEQGTAKSNRQVASDIGSSHHNGKISPSNTNALAYILLFTCREEALLIYRIVHESYMKVLLNDND